MEVEDKLDPFNPWKVESIDQFLYYCCPECDIKQKTKSDFIIHAIDAHPGSREYLPMFDFEDDDRNLSYLDTLEPLNRVSVKLEPLSLDGLLKMECDEEDCGRLFVTQESLLDHKNQFHQKKPVKQIKTPKTLELDNVVEDIESSECLESNMDYDTISNDFHQDVESDSDAKENSSNIILEDAVENVKCEICQKTFNQKNSLRKHYIEIHPSFEIPDNFKEMKDTKETSSKQILKKNFQRHLKNCGPKEEQQQLSQKRKLTDPDDEYGKPVRKKRDQQFSTQSGCNGHTKSLHLSEPEVTKKGKPARPVKYTQAIDPADGIQKYKCDECDIFFQCTKSVLRHKRKHHSKDQEKQKCLLCAEVVPSKLLNFHMRKKHANANAMFECDLCSEQFKISKPEQFMFHMTKEHQIGEFRHMCDQCDKVVATKHELENHKKIHHTKSCSVICDKCGKECLTQSNLNKHLKMVHHMYNITKEDTIKRCDKCDIEFDKPEDFNDHLRHCLDDLKDFKCKLCDSHWVSHLSLWQHIAIDHQLIQHVCEVCGLISTTLEGLKKHKKHIHDKVYDFVCHICAQPKQNKRLLDRHMIIAHGQGERKFKCDKCDKSFAQKSTLNHHFESHHAKKTLYQCEQCPKTFWMKSYLKTHVRMMHENYRPHKCDICQQGFVYKRDVVSHKKQIHNIHE